MLDLFLDVIFKSSESDVFLIFGDLSLMFVEDRFDGVQLLKLKVFYGVVKCWRVMYQIVDFYLLFFCEVKNKGFMRWSIIGRVLGGDMKLKC